MNLLMWVKKCEVPPSDGSIPNMPGWQWIHTPGHSPGHISLFREKDRSLIAGDAFVAVKTRFIVQSVYSRTRNQWSAKIFYYRLGIGEEILL